MESLLDASAILSHVSGLEARVAEEQHRKLQQQQHHGEVSMSVSSSSSDFGHRKSPELQLCPVNDINSSSKNQRGRQFMVLTAVTERCVSAQLWDVPVQELRPPSTTNYSSSGIGNSSYGSPVEVLVVDDLDDSITCTTTVVLENLDLAAPELTTTATVVNNTTMSDQNKTNNGGGGGGGDGGGASSLMSGGVTPVGIQLQRVAVIVGTSKGRVVSTEFTIDPSSSLAMTRRTFHVGSQLCTYFEPLPLECLLPSQQPGQRQVVTTTPEQSRWIRRSRNKGGNNEDKTNKNDKKIIVPFDPKGGVSSLMSYSVPTEDTPNSKDQGDNGPDGSSGSTSTPSTFVWIGFADGCAVRLNHAAFFSSVVQKYTDYIEQVKDAGGLTPSSSFPTETLSTLEAQIGQPLIKLHLHLPALPTSETTSTATVASQTHNKRDSLVVLPLPKFHRTPFAITGDGIARSSSYFDPMTWTPTPEHPQSDNPQDDNGVESGSNSGDDKFSDAVPTDGDDSHTKTKGITGDKQNIALESDWYEDYEAVVYNRNPSMADSFPTIAFFTSEDQYTDLFQSSVQQSFGYFDYEEKKDMDGGDSIGLGGNPIAAIVGGIFGIFGGSGNRDDNNTETNDNKNSSGGGDVDAMDIDTEAPASVSDEWDPVVPFPSMNRQPIDLFSGVQLFDPPRQVRQLSISPNGKLAAFSDSLGRVSLIDLRTKQVVRMWKGYREATASWCTLPRPGRQPLTFIVIHSRQRRVVEIWHTTHGPLLKTLQVGRESQVISSKQWTEHGYVHNCYVATSTAPNSSVNIIDRIFVGFELSGQHNDSYNMRDGSAGGHYSQIGHSLQSQDDAKRMNRLKQLLGDTNVKCQSSDIFVVLQDIRSLDDLAVGLDMIARSPALEEDMAVEGSTFQRLAISHCQQQLDAAVRRGGDIAMSNRHVNFLAFKIAYFTQVCDAYDSLRRYEMRTKGSDSSAGGKLSGTACSWGLEAAGWTSTYASLKAIEVNDSSDAVTSKDIMKFYQFASCLAPPKKQVDTDDRNRMSLYLSDSSRTRKSVVDRIFDPLTSDVFSFSVVNQIFDSLGLIHDHDYKLRCFGEWFTSLSLKEATKKTVFTIESPAIRWLKEIISRQLEDQSASAPIRPMQSLYDFCVESEDLLRAFWLGSLCHQAVKDVSFEKEEKSYGKIKSSAVVQPWDEMLRKLRVCMLVSLRLRVNTLGACPLSIKAVEAGDNFSIYQWLAIDELKMSHSQPEIHSLEVACLMSNKAFDPSKPEGDDPARWKMLQRSCLSSSLGEGERAEYMIDFDDDERLGALHLYLKPHNRSEVLVAHRSLLLASQWGHSPSDLKLLRDSISALEAIEVEGNLPLAFAMRLELWQSHIRPIYRAVVSGFHGVPEVSPEVLEPLIQDSTWIDEFSKISAEILQMVADVNAQQDDRNISQWVALVDNDDSTWPPVRECFLLQRYVKKNKPLSPSSLTSHQGVIYALRIANETSLDPTGCIPSFYDLFTRSSLFSDVDVGGEDTEEAQHRFMQESIVHLAKNYHGPSLESLASALGDINVLTRLWEFDASNINTLFLLAMYEYGKDAAVDDLLTKSASVINVSFFVDEGLDIIVRRIHYILNVNPQPEIRNIIPALDADVCSWVEEKATESEPLSNAKAGVKIGSTHLFGLRLLSLAASADVSKQVRIQIHSLIVLSGTIVKMLETSPGSEGAHAMASPGGGGGRPS
eukprot:CAMPEP_0113446134 /NCGR_PEP_ID=MMETSP0014_2-20120614/3546_1 /TAXON_ID=2857 /ORGANISM="Nitzschia sp." /LENGTH=1707 /DNA_ID=CAMNT_0000337209 /DNA_START=52 /DNA_END=5175 /DNA_ORIENTATION=- /assembly_acc=CAM_ASM_000159